MSARAEVCSAVPDFLRFAQLAERSPEQRRRVWEQVYREPNEAVLRAYRDLCGDPDDVDLALDRVLREVDAIETRERRVYELTPEVAARVAQLLGIEHLSCRYVALVGFHAADMLMTSRGARLPS